jgi:hypothetical protein
VLQFGGTVISGCFITVDYDLISLDPVLAQLVERNAGLVLCCEACGRPLPGLWPSVLLAVGLVGVPPCFRAFALCFLTPVSFW